MILVTGASGLVGNYIVRDLLKKEYKVRAIKRSSTNLELLADIKNEIDWVEADVLDEISLNNTFIGVTKVIHAAAIVSYNKKDHKAMNEVNVKGTANIVNCCLRHKVEKLIHISSIAALGRPSIDGAIQSETTKWEESKYNTAYAFTKHLAELEVWRGQEEGLSVAIVNPSIILAPGNWEQSSTKVFKYIWSGGKLYPKGKVNYVDIRDVTNAVIKLLELPIEGERFILNSGSVLYKDFFRLIANQFKKKPPFLSVNRTLYIFAYVFESVKAIITGKDALITRETIRLSRMENSYDNGKARDLLAMEFTDLEDTIEWTCSSLIKKYSF